MLDTAINHVVLIGAVSEHREKNGRQRFYVATREIIQVPARDGSPARSLEVEGSAWVVAPEGMTIVKNGATVLVLGHLAEHEYDVKGVTVKRLEVVPNLIADVSDHTPHRNVISWAGYMHHAAEMRYTAGGRPVADLRSAAGPKGQSVWVNAVAWGGRAELAARIMPGTRIALQGRLKTEEFTRRDGTKGITTKIEVVVLEVEWTRLFEDEAREAREPRDNGRRGEPAPAHEVDDDIPF